MAVDIFLMIPGVRVKRPMQSSSQIAIDVQSWTWGMTQAGSAGRGREAARGRSTFTTSP